jgi:hypothetical protein
MAEKLARFQEEKRRATGSMWHEHPINHLKEEKGCGRCLWQRECAGEL